MSRAVIEVNNLSKQYRLGQVGTTTVTDDFKRWVYRLRGKEDPFLKIGEENDRSTKGVSEYVWALKDINFSVQQGDVLGIIGKNGAGKSTLLKILSRTTAPTTGEYKIKGRVASLLEVGTGFHPDLTGRENVFLNGAILGMTRSEIKSNFDEIVSFSGVERYIDTPVKRYSSGMYVRLAFAVAAHLEPEILIVDEVLAVGDAEFQKKCLGKMKDVSGQGRTVLFVSHNIAAVKALCTTGILMQNGRLVESGSIGPVVNRYLSTGQVNRTVDYLDDRKNAPGDNGITLLRVSIDPRTGDQLSIFSGIDINLVFKNELEGKNLDLTFEVLDAEETVIFHNGILISNDNDSKKGFYTIKCKLPRQLLNTGTYLLNLIYGENQRYLIYKAESIVSFEVMQDMAGSNSDRIPGVIFPELNFEISHSSTIG